MKKITLSMLVLGLITVIPLATNAAVFEYVNTQGTLQTVVASSPEEAMAIAPQIALHSGVMYFTGNVDSNGVNIYKYVNTQGNVQTISANSAAEALNASNIAPHSGVMLSSTM